MRLESRCNLLINLVRRVPGVSERTVVQADFMSEGERVASVRTGTNKGLRDELGTTRAYLLGDSYPDGEIIFSAEKRVSVPLIGEIVVEPQKPIGKGPEAFHKALEILT